MAEPTYVVTRYKNVDVFQDDLNQSTAQYDLHSWQERSEKDGGMIVAVYKRRPFNG
jgi:hypothetical protein